MPWMPWFCQNDVFCRAFCQNAVVLRFHNNILFLSSIIWSLLSLCEFNTKYLPLLCLCYQSRCALLLTGGICDRDVIVVCILSRIYAFLMLETMSLLPWFCRDFCDFHKSVPCFLPFFAVIFYCPYTQLKVTRIDHWRRQHLVRWGVRN